MATYKALTDFYFGTQNVEKDSEVEMTEVQAKYLGHAVEKVNLKAREVAERAAAREKENTAREEAAADAVANAPRAEQDPTRATIAGIMKTKGT